MRGSLRNNKEVLHSAAKEMAFYFFLCALFVAGVLQLPGVAAQSQCVGASFDTFFDGFRYTASLSLNGCQSSQIKYALSVKPDRQYIGLSS